VSANTSDPDQTRLLERWRLRHAYPDAVTLWAKSRNSDARGLAFNAVAQDPRVLHRAARPQAIKMAAQAEDFALSLAQAGPASSETWRAAALFVLRSIDAWRNSFKARGRGAVLGFSAVSRTHMPARDPWETAWRNFPEVDDDTGRLAVRVLRKVGADMLARVRKPWDHVIALAVLRYAARLLRDEVSCQGSEFTCGNIIDDVGVVDRYAKSAGLAPMIVPYTGFGKPAQQGLRLFRDARTLRDAVHAAGNGDAEKVAEWQRAIDLHAFAVVAMDHRILMDLPLDDAWQLAAAALRHAEAAIEAPDTVQMPLLPSGSVIAPEVVALYADACLPERHRKP
jgi:hypothetical protein